MGGLGVNVQHFPLNLLVVLTTLTLPCERDFAIFAAFKEPMALNLAHRSFKVFHFGGN